MNYTIRILSIAILPAVGLLAGCSNSQTRESDFESGWSLVEQGEEPNLREAIETFEACIDSNPDDALCHAGLAIAYALISGDYNITDPAKVSSEARNAAARALELDDQLAFAHFAMAEVQVEFDWNWAEAERHFQRAIELDPTNALAIEQYCFFLMNLGHMDEASHMIAKLQSVDPKRPIDFLEYLITGDVERAENAITKLIESDPKNLLGYWMGSCVSAREGDYAKAARRLKKQISLMDGDVDDEVAMLGWVYGRLGRTDDARQMLELLDEVNPDGAYISPVVRSWIYIGLGETDRALSLLEEGIKRRANRSGIGMGHFFAFLYEPISDDPRYQALLTEIGLRN